MTRAEVEKRLRLAEAKAPRPDPRDEAMAAAETTFEQALGCPLSELPADDLHRVLQLIAEAPAFAHPLVLRACVGRPEDREPELGSNHRSRPTPRAAYP